MRKKLFAFSDKITSKGLYDSLSNEEKKIVDGFRDYMLITASPIRAGEGIREVLRFRKIVGVEFNDIDLEDLRYFLKEVKNVKFADYTKDKMKTFVQRFLRWKFRDWAVRFDEFEDIKVNIDSQRKKPITSKDVFKKSELEALMKNETSLFYKTFLIVQWEGALRTKECRFLEWEKITFEDDGFAILKIPSKKNKTATINVRNIPLKESSYYLKELKEQQRAEKMKSKYVFPSPENPNKPISKGVNNWFSKLTKKVLGKSKNNYLLRHTRGTELKKLIKEGAMSKDNATEFMGHSEKMFDKVYSHMDKDDIKDLMKKQIYNFEYLPEEKKHELELKVEAQGKQIEQLNNELKDISKIIKQLK